MSVDLNKIQKYKLFVGTPMYGGICNNLYLGSMLNIQNVCSQIGLQLTFFSVANESIVSFARNNVVKEFLETDYTHLLFVDADIGFDPDDII